MHVCIYVHICIHIHICMYVCVCVYIYIYIYIYISYIYIYIRMYVCMYVCIYIYIYTHTHTHIYIYTYIYIHTHTHTGHNNRWNGRGIRLRWRCWFQVREGQRKIKVKITREIKSHISGCADGVESRWERARACSQKIKKICWFQVCVREGGRSLACERQREKSLTDTQIRRHADAQAHRRT